MPTTTITSWTRATRAVTPNFTSGTGGDPEEDARRPDDDQDDRLPDQVRRDHRADRRQRRLLGDRAERGLQGGDHLAALPLGRELGVADVRAG